MPVTRNLSGKQLGEKTRELLNLIEENKDWEKYVSDDCKLLIKTLAKNKNMTDTLEELDLKYPTARSRVLRSIERIKSKNTSFMRDGKSENSQELLKLVSKKGWKNNLTDKEIMIVEEFKISKNFYETGRRLGVQPSNIYGILYGNSQKRGVINKIKKEKLC